MSCHREDTSVSQQKTLPRVRDHRMRHLPVVDGGRVVGMISIGGPIKAVTAEWQLHIEQPER